MAATRLNDSQKQELVARYRAGDSSQVLAEVFGCSANTVSRIVKAALDPADYEALKQQRSRPAARSANSSVAAPTKAVAAPAGDDVDAEADADDDHRVLAIDDADDFGEDDDGELDAELDVEFEGDEAETFVVVPLALGESSSPEPLACRPFTAAGLPSSLYMLVDKTVELQARALKEVPELGQLPAEEEERQALVLFANPRQAKRLCGRSQRVIKMPDPAVLERTAPYLLAQGISRLVVEGALYSLPGS